MTDREIRLVARVRGPVDRLYCPCCGRAIRGLHRLDVIGQWESDAHCGNQECASNHGASLRFVLSSSTPIDR